LNSFSEIEAAENDCKSKFESGVDLLRVFTCAKIWLKTRGKMSQAYANGD